MPPLNKVCELEDFAHPALAGVIREVFPHEVERFGPRFPTGAEYRKHWEVGMAVRALTELGAVRPDAEVLGVGAGNEPTVFHLTNLVKRVFATDLYVSKEWAESANPGMLTDPGRYWPRPWNPRRLVAQHMNALELQYEDGTFDGVFSSSSFEHFGGHAEVARAVREAHRVLKPGGVFSVSTEFRLAGPPPGMPGVLMFDPGELREVVAGAADWLPADVPSGRVSAATWGTEYPFAEAIKDVQAHVARHGELFFHKLDWRHYPHVVLRHGELVWTSVHLALRKRG